MGMLSSKMRDVLIDHLDGRAVPIVKPIGASGGAYKAVEALAASRDADRSLTIRALLTRGFLKHNSNRAKPPTHTLITEAGRKELGALLGEYADAILRARFEMPPSGDGADITRWHDRRRREAAYFPVDIPAADAHLIGDNCTRSEGADDGSPTETGREG